MTNFVRTGHNFIVFYLCSVDMFGMTYSLEVFAKQGLFQSKNGGVTFYCTVYVYIVVHINFATTMFILIIKKIKIIID